MTVGQGVADQEADRAARGPATWLPRVGLVAGSLAAALGLTLLLRPWLTYSQFVFFYAAVMVAAAVGGMWLAVPAVAATLIIVEFALIGGTGMPALSLDLLVRDGSVAAVSIGAALLVNALRKARLEADARTQEAEGLAGALREQTVELERQVSESEAMATELEDVNRALELQTDAARRGAVRSDRLQRLTALLLETTGEAGIAAVITREARRYVEADVSAFAVLAPGGELVLAATDGTPPAFALGTQPTPLADVVHTGEPLWIAGRDELARRYPDIVGLLGLSAVAVLPLTLEERPIGALLFGFRRGGEFVGEDRSFMQLIAHEAAQAMERSRLHQMSMRARIRAEFAERRLAFLAEASARLTASFDYRMTLSSLAEMCAPEFADGCLVHLHDEDGSPHLIAVAHADDDIAAACRALEERHPGACVLVERAAQRRLASCLHVPVVDDHVLRDVARDDEHVDALRGLAFESQLIAPVIVDDEVRGTITLVHGPSGRSFGEADVRLAAELGRRAGQAVENARLYQAAQFASEAKSDFLAVISHELRTPLNAIIGYTDLVLLGIPAEVPAQTRRQVERIRSASDGLLALVEEVLSFSRIEAGKEELRISPLDASALLRECVALVEPMAAQKSLELHLRLPDEPLKLVSDERKIRQIVTNLLSNAVKFTEQGSITVSAQSDGREIRVDVADTGIGIPAQHLERIFDPFWQVEQSATRRFGGTGLGLGVARKLARLLEGRLEVQSELGKGSRFSLFLPLRVPGLERRA